MSLIDEILSKENISKAVDRVVSNKGAPGVDRMPVQEVRSYIETHYEVICDEIRNMRYQPELVRRVYIPKRNGSKRPLGIPTVVDRVIQQAVAQVFSEIYEPEFLDRSYGFRPGRSAHDAMKQAVAYLNEGYTWVIDLDIAKFFDTVNHDKLISLLRLKINEKPVLHLVRQFLKAGILENGIIHDNELGTPQGGPLSPVLANIYLNEFDRELARRGLRSVRYADDCDIFVKSRRSAERVKESVSRWLEDKLFLKVNMEKTKVVRPSKSVFLGFNFYYAPWRKQWSCRPSDDAKKRLKDSIRAVLVRKRAVAQPMDKVFLTLNQKIQGWINYYSIGYMKTFMTEIGMWLRHKVRVLYLKIWKRPKTIYRNLTKLNKFYGCGFSAERIRITANSRLGLWRSSTGDVVNFCIPPKFLNTNNHNRRGLVDPLHYYLSTNRVL